MFRLLGSAIAWVSGLPKGLRERRFYSARSARCERTYQDCAIHWKTKLVFEYSGSSPNRHSRKRTSYLRPPSQNPVFLNSRTNSMFLHSCKQPVPATDTFFASRGCPLTRAFIVNVLWHSTSLCLFQSYIKEPFRVRREALRSSFTEVEGVGNIHNNYFSLPCRVLIA